MIELAGLFYTMLKDLKNFLEFEEETKEVDSEWLETSGFKVKAEQDGFTLYWSQPKNVASREIDGYSIMFEVDKTKRKRRRLVRYDKSILMGKRT